MPIRVTVDSASSLKAHMLAPEHRLVGDPYGASSLRVNPGRYTDLTPPVLQNLIAYWPLASEGEVDLTDYVSGLNLTNNNSVTRGDGPSLSLPDSAVFDADSEQSLSREADGVTLGGGSFEGALWMKYASSSGERVAISQYDTNNQRSWVVSSVGGSTTPRFTTTAAGTGAGLLALDASPISTDTWAMVGFYFDAEREKAGIYLNDGDPTEGDQTAVHASTATFYIGARGDTPMAFMDGAIASVGLWSRVLSAAERAWLYNGGTGRDLRSYLT